MIFGSRTCAGAPMDGEMKLVVALTIYACLVLALGFVLARTAPVDLHEDDLGDEEDCR